MNNITPSNWFRNYSFSESIKETVSIYGDIKNEQVINDWNSIMPIYIGLIAIGSLHSEAPSSTQVINCVKEFIDSYCNNMQVDMNEEDRVELAKYSEAELIDAILITLDDLFTDKNFQKEIEDQAGPGSREFIHKAIAEYGKSKCMQTEDWEHVVSKVKEEM